MGINNALRFGSGLDPFSVIRNGMVTWEFQMLIAWTLLLVSMLIRLFYIIREKKARKRGADDSERE